MRGVTYRAATAALLAVAVCAAAYAAFCAGEDRQARDEYGSLADAGAPCAETAPPEGEPDTVTGDAPETGGAGRHAAPARGHRGLPTVDEDFLRGVNGDYAAWLCIPELGVSLPVTYTAEEGKYLGTTFSGRRNSAGCLFFDRCAAPFVQPNTVIHGHNMRDGSMFGSLKGLLSDGYAGREVEAYVCTDGEWRGYRVLSAYTVRRGDAFPYRTCFADAEDFDGYVLQSLGRSAVAYAGTAAGGTMLTLSTCHAGRMLVVQMTGPL